LELLALLRRYSVVGRGVKGRGKKERRKRRRRRRRRRVQTCEYERFREGA
jgi:hypothetical protein